MLLVCSVVDAGTFYYRQDGTKVFVVPTVQGRSGDNSAVRYYSDANGRSFGVGDQIIVECNLPKQCLDTLKRYSFKAIEKLSDSLYLVTLQDGSEVFDVSQKLFHEESIRLAHPNFVKRRYKR